MLSIQSPAACPNADGIRIQNTNNVRISNSFVSKGDDHLSIGDGCYEHWEAWDHNSRAYVSNITVTDSVIKQSDNGVQIKTWQGGRGSVSEVTFQNIRMDNVRNPIIID